jgi:hypothetical protein
VLIRYVVVVGVELCEVVEARKFQVEIGVGCQDFESRLVALLAKSREHIDLGPNIHVLAIRATKVAFVPAVQLPLYSKYKRY